MSIAALIADMVKAGVDADLIGRTAELLAAREAVPVVDEAAQRRRAADRERKRLRNSAEFCGTGSPDKEIPPTPPKEINPSPSLRSVSSGAGERMLAEAGVGSDVLADWKAVRKAKKAGPITETVANATIREASKAGLSAHAAVRMAAERGWQGFKADWAMAEARAGPGARQKSVIDHLRALDHGNDQSGFGGAFVSLPGAEQQRSAADGDGLFDGDRWPAS